LIKKLKYYLLLLLSIAMLATCSPTTQYNVLSFVFDGVPDPNYVEKEDTLLVANNNQITEVKENKLISDKYFHEPYKERDCFMCHDEVQKSRLNQEQPDLCYYCHEDFNDKYKVLHGPVAGGFCTECHTAHMGDYDKVLLREGQDLCLTCHRSKDVFKNENHADLDGASCTDCHNPHGGDDRFLF